MTLRAAALARKKPGRAQDIKYNNNNKNNDNVNDDKRKFFTKFNKV